MSLVTHVFSSHQRFENGVLVSNDAVPRRANFEYDASGNNVVITIIPTLSAKRATLVKQVGFTLYYQGEDSRFRFEMECWPDNGTIKRFSVFRVDANVEIRYISTHQDRL